MRGKSTTQSHRALIYYFDLTVRSGRMLAEAIAGVRAKDEHLKGAGSNQMALENAERQGFGNGTFEESEEEGRIWWRSFIEINLVAISKAA